MWRVGIAVLIMAAGAISQSHEKLLYDVLFNTSTYTNKLRPRVRAEDTLDVLINFELSQIQSLDEVDQVIYTSGFVVASWRDDYLTWNPEDYWDIDELIIPPSDVWLPDFGIVNSADTFYETIYSTHYRVHVKHTGLVLWSFGGNFATRCQLDLTFFPFDHQSCDITFENWAYPEEQVSLMNASAGVTLDDYQTNGEWHLSGSGVTNSIIYHDIYPQLGFPKVSYSLYIRRKSGYYALNILTPCYLILVLAMLMFWLPADSGEKVSLGVTVLLAFSVFQLVIAENTPKTSDYSPLLSLYVAFIMAMAVVSTMVSIVILYFHHHLPTSPVPALARKIFFRWLGRAFCMRDELPEVGQASGKVSPVAFTTTEKKKANNGPDVVTTKATAFLQDLELAESRSPSSSSSTSNDADDVRLAQIAVNLQYIVDRLKQQDKDEKLIDEWKCLGRVIDRLFFWLSAVIVLTFVTVVIVFGATMHNRAPSIPTTDIHQADTYVAEH